MNNYARLRALSSKWPQWACITPVLARLIVIPYLLIVVMVGITIYWHINHVQPLVIVGQPNIPKIKRGEVGTIEADVIRDSRPNCVIDASRYIVSSLGYRYYFDDDIHMDSASLAVVTAGHKNKLLTTIVVPTSIPTGRSQVVSTLTYRCTPLDYVFPIVGTTELEFDVVE